jgi:hypothetical protein
VPANINITSQVAFTHSWREQPITPAIQNGCDYLVLKRHASPNFWACFEDLTDHVRDLATKNFKLLKDNRSRGSQARYLSVVSHPEDGVRWPVSERLVVLELLEELGVVLEHTVFITKLHRPNTENE